MPELYETVPVEASPPVHGPMLALEQALAIAQARDTWDVHDDLCDCVYQRIGYWFNPYIGETTEIRLCCVWAELEKQYPQHFRHTKQEPAEWDGEADMPKSVFHRQLANHLGVSISKARSFNMEPPKGRPIAEKPKLLLPWSGEWLEVELG